MRAEPAAACRSAAMCGSRSDRWRRARLRDPQGHQWRVAVPAHPDGCHRRHRKSRVARAGRGQLFRRRLDGADVCGKGARADDAARCTQPRHQFQIRRARRTSCIFTSTASPPTCATLCAPIATSIGDQWAPLHDPACGSSLLRARVMGETLAGQDPFKLLAQGIPGADADMALYTIVVAGMDFDDGKPGFVILADRVDLAACRLCAQAAARWRG